MLHQYTDKHVRVSPRLMFNVHLSENQMISLTSGDDLEIRTENCQKGLKRDILPCALCMSLQFSDHCSTKIMAHILLEYFN